MKKNDLKQFEAIAAENKQKKATTLNVDMSTIEEQASKELSETEKINGFYATHAIEHYCEILNEVVEDVTATIEGLKKENGVYWLFTSPVFSESKTQSDWEKENESKGVIFVEKVVNNYWYKRPFVIGNANGVKNLINGYSRYLEDKDNSTERERKTFEKAAKLAGMELNDFLKLVKREDLIKK